MRALALVAALVASSALAQSSGVTLGGRIVEVCEGQLCYLRCSGNQTLSGSLTITGTARAAKFIQTGTTGPGYTSNVNAGQYAFFDTNMNGGIVSAVNAMTIQVAGAAAIAIGSGSQTTFSQFPVNSTLGYFSSLNNGTAGSGTGITVGTTAAVVTKLHKITVTNTAMTAAATTDITLWTTPVNTRIVRLVAEVTQTFTGGALTAVTVQCGNSAGGTQYLLANSVFTATNTWGDVAAEIGAGLLSATVADMGTPAAGIPGALTVQCRFTCTTANCNAATQGSVSFYLELLTYQ